MGGQDLAADKLDSYEVRFLRQCVDQLLGHIEQQQERAVASWRDGETQHAFVHTLELQDQKRPVQLKVYYPKKGGRDAEHQQHRVALLLDMDALGAVRVDLAMMDRQLMMGFFVESKGVQKLMEQHIQKVETSLAGQFDIIQINVAVSQEKIAQFNKADFGKSDNGRINLNI
jgi:flagellar hook-length control protein FliK